MASRKAQVTQTEISRTLKGAVNAGVEVGHFEVDHITGKVKIWPTASLDTKGINPCDELLK